GTWTGTASRCCPGSRRASGWWWAACRSSRTERPSRRRPRRRRGRSRAMFVELFLRRPVLATVCSLIIVLGGAVAIPTLPVAQYPQLASPQVTVNAFFLGADAQSVESAVTTPLEQAINGTAGMQYIQSSSGSDGS